MEKGGPHAFPVTGGGNFGDEPAITYHDIGTPGSHADRHLYHEPHGDSYQRSRPLEKRKDCHRRCSPYRFHLHFSSCLRLFPPTRSEPADGTESKSTIRQHATARGLCSEEFWGCIAAGDPPGPEPRE